MSPKSLLAVAVVLGGLIGAPMPAAAAPAAVRTGFQDCDTLHGTWPHGVGWFGARDHVADSTDTPVTDFYRSDSQYLANRSLDRDDDGIACEMH